MTKVNKRRMQSIQEDQLYDNSQQDELEIDIVALLYRLIEKAAWLIATALVAAVLAGVLTQNFITPLYKSTAKLYVLPSQDSAINLNDLSIGERLAADYVQVFKNWHVHEMVIKSLDLPYNYNEIQDMLSISVISNTRLIQITVTSPDAQEAKDIAMAYATFAPKFIEAKMDTTQPSIFEEARVPAAPSSPNMLRNVLLGFVIGFMLAAVIIVVHFIVDDRVRNADQLEKQLSLPVLGLMPIQEDQKASKKKSGRRDAK